MNVPLAIFNIIMASIFIYNFCQNIKEHDLILTLLECSFITLQILTVLYLLGVVK